jgi:hypothetical protein
MSNEAKLTQLSNRFSDLMAEIKARTDGGLDISSLRENQLVVKQGESLQSAGVPQNMAFRDLFAGSALPVNTLGKDGDLYFRVQAANEAQAPGVGKWIDASFGKGVFIAINDGGDFCIRSDNGVSWTKVNMPVEARWCGVASNGNGTWMAISFHGETAHSTDNGLSWTAGDNLTEGIYWNGLEYGNGKFLATTYIDRGTGEKNDLYAYTSNNGVSWNYNTFPTAEVGSNLVYGSTGGWVQVHAGTDFVYQSNDGLSWTKHMLPREGVWSGIHYTDGRYIVAMNSSTYAAYSDNGINWNLVALPRVSNWYRSAGGDGISIIAPGYSDVIAVSFDHGMNWVEYDTGMSGEWLSIAYGSGRFVLFGYDTSNIMFIDSADLLSEPADLDDYDPYDPPEDLQPGPLPPGHGSRPGAYCKSPETDLADLTVFFTAAASTGTIASVWPHDPSRNVGTFYQTPVGITSMSIIKDGAGVKVSVSGKRSVLSRIGHWWGHQVQASFLDNSCNSLGGAVSTSLPSKDGDPDDVITWVSPSISGVNFSANQRYVLEML